jgi:hypothetical protein
LCFAYFIIWLCAFVYDTSSVLWFIWLVMWNKYIFMLKKILSLSQIFLKWFFQKPSGKTLTLFWVKAYISEVHWSTYFVASLRVSSGKPSNQELLQMTFGPKLDFKLFENQQKVFSESVRGITVPIWGEDSRSTQDIYFFPKYTIITIICTLQ